MLRKFRKYAFVAILILAAFITPTTDPFTMMIVATPLYLLYELSIMVCKNKSLSDPLSGDEDEDEDEEDEDEETETTENEVASAED